MTEVTLFFRHPQPEHNHSIEELFDAVVPHLEQRVRIRKVYLPVLSRGIVRRIVLALVAAAHSGRINHVTGDVNFIANFLPARRTVLTIHDCGATRLGRFRGWIHDLIWLKLPVGRLPITIAVSEATKSELVRRTGVDPAKIRVVPNCVSNLFAPAPEKFDKADPEFLVVGTFPHKNIERIIEALTRIQCRLHFIGQLSEEHVAALNQAKLRYRNSYSISLEEIVQAYRNCDALLFPSTFEGFGRPIIEAQSVGRPVITSALSPMREVAGDGAILVDPESVDAIRSAALSLIEDSTLRAKLRTAGFKNTERFAPAAVSSQLYAIYRELGAE